MNELDPRVKRTKKMFKNALKELMLSNKDYMDITVKELCEKAELNRRTFYLHYEYPLKRHRYIHNANKMFFY